RLFDFSDRVAVLGRQRLRRESSPGVRGISRNMAGVCSALCSRKCLHEYPFRRTTERRLPYDRSAKRAPFFAVAVVPNESPNLQLRNDDSTKARTSTTHGLG